MKCVVCGEEKKHYAKNKCEQCHRQEYSRRPEVKEHRREYQREYHQRPEVKEKQRKYWRRRKVLIDERTDFLLSLSAEELLKQVREE